MRWIPLVSTLVLASLLAGCAGGAQKADLKQRVDVGRDLQVTDTTGILVGVVIDEAYRPIPNVAVRISLPNDEGLAIEHRGTTNEAGAFGFEALQPGLWIVEASKAGYRKAQATAVVAAGVPDPDAVKLTLATDLATKPYATLQVYDGYIECTTSVIVLCGAPNILSPVICAASQRVVCLGNVTADRYTPTLYYDPGAALIVTELVWESTQALSPELYLEVESGDDIEYMGGARGASPLAVHLNQTLLEEFGIGGDVGIYYSVFTNPVVRDPVLGRGPGVTLQQKVQFFSTAFYRYLPPEGWTFAATGEIPPPQ